MNTKFYYFYGILLLFISHTFANSITEISNFSTAIQNHQSVVLLNGNVVVFGGNNGKHSNNGFSYTTYHNKSFIYTPTTDTWTSSSGDAKFYCHRRSEGGAVLLNDGRVLAFGGHYYSQYKKYEVQQSEVYNPTTKEWTSVDSTHFTYLSPAFVKLNSGHVLVVNADGNSEVFNPSTNTWTVIDPTNFSRSVHPSLIKLMDGRVLLIGGTLSSDNAKPEIFDPKTNSWTPLAINSKYNYPYSFSTLLNDGRVLLMDNQECEIFNPSNNTFSEASPIPSSTNGPAITLNNGKVLVMGLGDAFSPQDPQNIFLYDPSLNQWETVSISNVIGSSEHTLSKLTNGDVLIIGGTTVIGSGAHKQVLSFSPSQNLCSLSNTSLKDDYTICYGENLIIETPSSNSIFSLENNQQKFFSFSSTKTLINTEHLGVGQHQYLIYEQQDDCSKAFTNKFLTITVQQELNSIPEISIINKEFICEEGESIKLVVQNTTNYQTIWNTGDIGDTLIVKNKGKYTAQYINQKSCRSLPSLLQQVYHLEQKNVKLELPENIDLCKHTLPDEYSLSASPLGGIWTYNDVTISENKINTDTLSKSNYSFQYQVCDLKDSFNVQLEDTTIISNFGEKLYVNDRCEKNYANIKFETENKFIDYHLLINDVETKKLKNSTYYKDNYNIDKGDVIVKIVWSTNFPVCNIEKHHELIDTSFYNKRPSTDFTAVLSDDTICYSNPVSLKISNSEVNTGYYLSYRRKNLDSYYSYTDTIYGNSNQDIEITIDDFESSSISSSRILNLYLITKKGCRSISKVQEDTVALTKIKDHDFDISLTGNINSDQYYKATSIDTLQLLLNSDADSIIWDFGNFQKTDINTNQEYIFNTSGEHEVICIGYDGHGCVDSISQKISIVPPLLNTSPLANNKVCEMKAFPDVYSYGILDMQKDKDGNSYFAFYKEKNPTYKKIRRFTVNKYNSKNELLWSISPFSNGSKNHNIFVRSIAVDSESNVYLAGGHLSNFLRIDTLYLEPSELSTQSFIMKLSPKGEILWYLGSDFDLGSRTEYGFSKVWLQNDTTICLIGNKVGSMNYSDTTISHNNDVELLKINHQGKYIGSFPIIKTDKDTEVYTNYYTGGSGYVTGITIPVNPYLIKLKTRNQYAVTYNYNKLSKEIRNIISNEEIKENDQGRIFIVFNEDLTAIDEIHSLFSYSGGVALDENDNIFFYQKNASETSNLTKTFTDTIISFPPNHSYIGKYSLNSQKTEYITHLPHIYPSYIFYNSFDKELILKTSKFSEFGWQESPEYVSKYLPYYLFKNTSYRMFGISLQGKLKWIEKFYGSTNTYYSECDNSIYLYGNAYSSFNFNNHLVEKEGDYVFKYSLDGTCKECPDCNGDIGGSAYTDYCGKCIEGNTGKVSTCKKDCNGQWGGTAYIDSCGTCVGGTTQISPCVKDCEGDWGGTAYIDNCETCIGGNTGLYPCSIDCNYEWGGTAYYDNCGDCVEGTTKKIACIKDCNSDWGGTAYLDSCNTCVEGKTQLTPCSIDCTGKWGIAYLDSCNICVGGTTSKLACVQDCAGVWGGSAYLDENCWGSCLGGTTGNNTPCKQDCEGDWGGAAFIDSCGNCVKGLWDNPILDKNKCLQSTYNQNNSFFKVYPTITNSSFIVEISFNVPIKFNVTNIHGKQVLNGIFHNSIKEIDLSTQPKGIYYLKLVRQDHEYIYKIILI